MEKQTTKLVSSYGELTIQTPNGNIIERNLQEPCYIDDIERFDIIEFNDWFFRRYGFQPSLDELDILELGFFTKDGKYVEPTKWRHEIREQLEKEGFLYVHNNI